MEIGLKKKDRELLQNLTNVFVKLGKDLNKNLTRLNENLEKKTKRKK